MNLNYLILTLLFLFCLLNTTSLNHSVFSQENSASDIIKKAQQNLASSGNATESNFLTYTNPTLGFTIQVPEDWSPDESSVSDAQMVRFNVPDKVIPIFVVSVDDVEPYLDTNTLTLQNTTLDQKVQEKKAFFSQLASNTDMEFRVIRETPLTVAGNDAIKLEYTLGGSYQFEVYTIVNGKLYSFIYSDIPLSVPETVKLANKAVESFELTRNSES